MIKEEIQKAEEEFEKKFKDMLDLVETQTGYSERENIKSFLSDYTTALLQSVVEEVEKLPNAVIKSIQGNKEVEIELKAKYLIDIKSHLKDIISQQEKHE